MNDRFLDKKNAVIHGAGGAIGGAIARAFARHGARVFLAGRTPAKLEAVAKVKMGKGVILTISTPGSRMVGTGYLGYGVTCAAVEAFSRLLAADLGPSGIRVICLQPHAIPEAAAMGSHSREVFRPVAERAGITVEEMLAGAAGGTLLGRLPTLDEVANVAAFLASDQAGAMTGTVANLTCGALVD
jgi:NAD(P)-dependent dehydrogenase (short-subunit alcohol dehydrogenase family)